MVIARTEERDIARIKVTIPRMSPTQRLRLLVLQAKSQTHHPPHHQPKVRPAVIIVVVVVVVVVAVVVVVVVVIPWPWMYSHGGSVRRAGRVAAVAHCSNSRPAAIVIG